MLVRQVLHVDLREAAAQGGEVLAGVPVQLGIEQGVGGNAEGVGVVAPGFADVARGLTLEEGRASVAQAAQMAGYRSATHFAAAFRQRFGLPPSRCKRGG